MNGTDAEAIQCLVAAAAQGDGAAWEDMVRRFGPMVRGIARSYRLNPADAAEVSQTSWLRLVQNIDRLQQPERVGSWLATTTRRECVLVARRSRRQVPVDSEALERAGTGSIGPPPIDTDLLRGEQSLTFRLALQRLSPRCQRLLGLLMADEASYREVSETLSMPPGSIGPTRGRCLEHLRRLLAESDIISMSA
ncbi:MAG: RNA polymerase sigma factor [Acidimicrobiales bacterium]